MEEWTNWGSVFGDIIQQRKPSSVSIGQLFFAGVCHTTGQKQQINLFTYCIGFDDIQHN